MVQVVEIQTTEICELSERIRLNSSAKLDIIEGLVLRMLYGFGVKPDIGHFGSRNNESDTERWTRTGSAVSLLCSLLSLAVVSYAGSHCSDLGARIWGSELDKITFEDVACLKDGTCCFLRRRLACLDSFIGGPVWVFGSAQVPDRALLSISIDLFGNLWGPLFAIPSTNGFEELLALQTEGGVLFRSQYSPTKVDINHDEVLIHW